MQDRAHWNGCRYIVDNKAQARGHYESWFQRANHPSRPLAFWIRYTIFSPAGRPQEAEGELWAIFFDGEKHTTTAVQEVFPLSECAFSPESIQHRIGKATLNSEQLSGSATGQGHNISWALTYRSPDPYLLLLPETLYRAPFPKAKSMVGSPLAHYSGTLCVDGEDIKIADWVGSQNHNWGSKHTDKYAWGQVAGFDNEADAFLEIATARVKLGPVWTPWMTVMVLRVDGEEYRLNSLVQSVRALGRYRCFSWNFSSSTRAASIVGSIWAPAEAFVGLPYRNPPGGGKTCLNSKIASCSLKLQRPGRALRKLSCQHRAAFEILSDDSDHGISVLAGRPYYK